MSGFKHNFSSYHRADGVVCQSAQAISTLECVQHCTQMDCFWHQTRKQGKSPWWNSETNGCELSPNTFHPALELKEGTNCLTIYCEHYSEDEECKERVWDDIDNKS